MGTTTKRSRAVGAGRLLRAAGGRIVHQENPRPWLVLAILAVAVLASCTLSALQGCAAVPSVVSVSVCDIRVQVGTAEIRHTEGRDELVIISPDVDVRVMANPDDLADLLERIGVTMPARCRAGRPQ